MLYVYKMVMKTTNAYVHTATRDPIAKVSDKIS